MRASSAASSVSAPEREDILRLAKAFSAEEVQLHYQIVIHGKNDLPQAPDEVTGFTMTLLRMLAFRPDAGGGARAEGAASRPAPARSAASAGASAAPAAPQRAVPAASAHTAQAAQRPAAAAAPATSMRAAPAPDEPSENPAPSAEQSAGRADEPVASGTFDGDWPALIARLPLTGFVRDWANKSEYKGASGGTFELCVGNRKMADDKPMQEKLRAAMEQYLGRPVRLSVTVGELAGASVAAITEKHNDERQRAAEASIMGDPFVKEMMEKVGAKPTNVRPA